MDNEIPLKMDDLTSGSTGKYKYLGEMLNKKNNLEDHTIDTIKKKVEAAIRTTFHVAGDDNYRGIEMDTIWTLLETCIIPIITHGGCMYEYAYVCMSLCMYAPMYVCMYVCM